MSNGSTPEDNRTFAEIQKRDPESLKCFECGYDNAPWAIASHGIFVCLDCSGQFRSLGVHLCFVRSSTMDGWSNWKPEKLLVMKAGGNSKCRRFFEAKGVPASNLSGKPGGVTLREKFSNKYAMMYKDLLQADADGVNFSEASWRAPDWWTQEQENLARRKDEIVRNSGGGSNNNNNSNINNNRSANVTAPTYTGQSKYEGFGSHPQGQPQQQRSQQDGFAADDFLNYLGSAASKISETTSYYAKEASTRTKAMYDDVDGKEISATAKKSADAVTEVASSAWGALSSWTTTGFSVISAFASQGVETIRKELDGENTSSSSNNNNNNNNKGAIPLSFQDDSDEVGLGGLTRNIRPSQQDYGHAEHSKAESNFTPYSSPQQPLAQQQRQGANNNNNNNNNSVAGTSTSNGVSTPTTSVPIQAISGPKPVLAATVKKTFSPAVKTTTLATTTTSVASPTTIAESNNDGNSNQQQQQQQKKAIPDDWGWEE